MGGRFIYIRYFAVRGGSGEYLGTLEVVQDITDIKKLEGEKRLLGWKKE
nr:MULTISPECIES: PAS domain-containing protein [unclassified Archaeoglobus]